MSSPVDLRWLVVVLVLAAGPANAQTVLITTAEAAVSSSASRPTLRSFHLRGAPSNGPLVTVVEPKPGRLLHANQPFDLSIAFQPAPGAEIDVESVELSYVNGRPVDLTPRISKDITPGGIGITDAVAPAGHHAFRLVVEDSRGRATTTNFTLNVGE